MSKKYSWSKSTIYNIRKQKSYYLHGKLKRPFVKESNREANTLMKQNSIYLNTYSFPLFVNDFQNMLEKKSSKPFPKHEVRKMIIQNADLSYKKISSRPLNYSRDVIEEGRTLFWVRFSKTLTPDTLIVNIMSAQSEEDVEQHTLGQKKSKPKMTKHKNYWFSQDYSYDYIEWMMACLIDISKYWFRIILLFIWSIWQHGWIKIVSLAIRKYQYC